MRKCVRSEAEIELNNGDKSILRFFIGKSISIIFALYLCGKHHLVISRESDFVCFFAWNFFLNAKNNHVRLMKTIELALLKQQKKVHINDDLIMKVSSENDDNSTTQ